MVPNDPYPGKMFLLLKEVKALLRISSGKDWNAFLAANPGFPEPVPVGKTRSGKPRKLYRKEDVYFWISRLH